MTVLGRVVVVLSAACWIAAAFAQAVELDASVDRPTVRANETFTYVLRANGPVSGRPDLSAVEQDFEVLDSRTATSLQIINGRRSQISEWSFEMMPRREGVFTLQLDHYASAPAQVQKALEASFRPSTDA